MSDWSSPNIVKSINMAQRKINKDKSYYIDAQKKEKHQSIWIQLKKVTNTKAYKTTEKTLVVFAYLGLALAGWYAAVLNLALLSLPVWVYRVLTLCVAVFSFLSNMVDWLMAHVDSPTQYTESKKMSLEHRFLISPQIRKERLQFGRRPNVLEDFAEDSFCHRDVRSQVRLLLIDECNLEGSGASRLDKRADFTGQKARWMMSREAKISSDQRGAQLAVADSMCEGQKTIRRMIGSRGCGLMDVIYKITGQSKENDGKISQEQIKNLQAEISKLKKAGEKIPNVVVLYMNLRSAYFARTYIEEVDNRGRLSEDERKESMRWSLIKIVEKRIKKERAIKATTKKIDVLAQILVWGNRLLTSALTILATAPIRFFSRCLGGHTETLLCLWFYFSGLLVGLSTHSVKKQLSKGYQWLINEKKGNKSLELKKMTVFRLFLSASTAMSSCYFGLFAIRRLLKRPEDIGAHILINFLSKWLLPQIWPIIMPVWVFLTISSAMINQYKDTKVFARLSIYLQWKWQSRNYNGVKEEGKIVDTIRDTLIASLVCIAAIAAALSIYVTVVKMTSSIMLSVLLSSCVWLISYAKYTVLCEKITQLMEDKKDVATTIRNRSGLSSHDLPSKKEIQFNNHPKKLMPSDFINKRVADQDLLEKEDEEDVELEKLIQERQKMGRRNTR